MANGESASDDSQPLKLQQFEVDAIKNVLNEKVSFKNFLKENLEPEDCAEELDLIDDGFENVPSMHMQKLTLEQKENAEKKGEEVPRDGAKFSMQDLEEQKNYLNNLYIIQSKNHMRQEEPVETYNSEGKAIAGDLDRDFLIPVVQPAKNQSKEASDKQQLIMALSRHVFSENTFIHNNVWQFKDRVTIDDINTYTKKLQYVKNIMHESFRDIIICTTICVVAVMFQYILSSLIMAFDALKLNTIATPGNASQVINNLTQIMKGGALMRNAGIMHTEGVIWVGLHEFILLIIKLH